MEALILSCSTGGGHNAAGIAIARELARRGWKTAMLDPYALLSGSVDQIVGDVYVGIAQKSPRLFGKIYAAGDLVRRIPWKSPVYLINRGMTAVLADYLERHPVDAIFMPHVFPAEIITGMRAAGYRLPMTVFVATDYVCIPFTEETDCDCYMTPSPALTPDFLARGIPKHKIYPFGIPVRWEFADSVDRKTAAKRLGLSPDFEYLVLSGGSMGAGEMEADVALIYRWLAAHPNYRLIVICGSNQHLYDRLKGLYGTDNQILLLHSVDRMPDYLHLATVYMTKPGGLSSTEAAVAGVPLIHLSPIPGCEDRNLAFFADRGMSLSARCPDDLIPALERLLNPETADAMICAQRKYIRQNSAARIAGFCEKQIAKNNGKELS
ncbi:MAG: glycosyltransferase [Eubacteriales bacterium]